MPRRPFIRRDVSGAKPAPAPVQPRPVEELPVFPESGPRADSPRPTIKAFGAGWAEVFTKAPPRNRDGTPNMQATPRIMFDVDRAADQWIRGVVAPRNAENPNAVADAYGSAILLGTFCLYSALNGWTPELLGPKKGQYAPLPELSVEFEQLVAVRQTVGVEEMYTSARTYAALMWGKFHGGSAKGRYVLDGGGPNPNHTIHVGVQMLGALAVMPENSGIGVRHNDESFGIRPVNVTVAGLPPYPAGRVVDLAR